MNSPQNNENSEILLSFVILCYRSGKQIIPFVEQLHNDSSMFSFNWELILVANYWPHLDDDTPRIAEELSHRLKNVRVVAQPKKGHMGWDMRKGLDACRGKYIGVIDGDGQFPMEAIFSCFMKIVNDDLDFVKTYRVRRYDGPMRLIMSMIYNTLFALLFLKGRNLHDVNGKPKIMKRSVYRRMNLKSNDWFIDAEIILKALEMDCLIYEIPVVFKSLEKRESFVRLTTAFEFFKNLVLYRLFRYGTGDFFASE
jgi:glycosyltransferase involved in cell wall biosynthesis